MPRKVVNIDTWYITDKARGVEPSAQSVLGTFNDIREAHTLLEATKNTLHANPDG